MTYLFLKPFHDYGYDYGYRNVNVKLKLSYYYEKSAEKGVTWL